VPEPPSEMAVNNWDCPTFKTVEPGEMETVIKVMFFVISLFTTMFGSE
jgi:hypothetical protein